MEQIHNISNISLITAINRVHLTDNSANITINRGIIGTFFLVESTLDRPTLEATLSPAETVDETNYLADYSATRQQLKDEYLNMITRLEQIQAAVNPTNTQVIQAVKDEALYIERIMKVIKKIIT